MPRASRLSVIEGIGPAIEAKLKAVGIKTVEGLLEACAAKRDREAVASRISMDEGKLLRFVNHADLMRIKGIGGEYSELLEASGVDSTLELAQRRSDNLTARMAEVNKTKRLVRQTPSEKQVQSWIEQAKQLKKVVTH